MTVKVQLFGNKEPRRPKLRDIREFTVSVDPRTLMESGVSFVGARGPFDKPADPGQTTPQLTKDAPRADDSAATWNRRAETLLAEMRKLPVQVDVLYNGESEKVDANPFRPPAERDNVLLRIRGPFPHEKVTFRLTNHSKDETFAVVLKVNGKNSIYMEEQAPLECYKWVLEPQQSTTVPGFLKRNDKKAGEFEVLTEADSQREEVNYGFNAGTFSFTIFRAAKSEADRIMANKEKERDVTIATIARGTDQLTERIAPSTLAAFRGEMKKLTMKEEEAAGSRGMIVAGKDVDKEVRNVNFTPVPVAAIHATIRYYDPKAK
jgi:hypothetical protein